MNNEAVLIASSIDPIALASAVVALCALAVTFWQAHLTRVHNKLSVRPMLTTHETHKKGDGFGFVKFELLNCGVGPAIIKSFVLLFGDKEVSRNNRRTFKEFLESHITDCESRYTGSMTPGVAFQAGARHPLLSFEYSISDKNIDFIHQLNLVVEYQSIYQDEVFTYDSRDDRKFHGLEAAE